MGPVPSRMFFFFFFGIRCVSEALLLLPMNNGTASTSQVMWRLFRRADLRRQWVAPSRRRTPQWVTHLMPRSLTVPWHHVRGQPPCSAFDRPAAHLMSRSHVARAEHHHAQWDTAAAHRTLPALSSTSRRILDQLLQDGDAKRGALARAITLLESTVVQKKLQGYAILFGALQQHKMKQQEEEQQQGPRAVGTNPLRRCMRIGVSGPPGVGA